LYAQNFVGGFPEKALKQINIISSEAPRIENWQTTTVVKE
jgi:hypothetical protein